MGPKFSPFSFLFKKIQFIFLFLLFRPIRFFLKIRFFFFFFFPKKTLNLKGLVNGFCTAKFFFKDQKVGFFFFRIRPEILIQKIKIKGKAGKKKKLVAPLHKIFC